MWISPSFFHIRVFRDNTELGTENSTAFQKAGVLTWLTIEFFRFETLLEEKMIDTYEPNLNDSQKN